MITREDIRELAAFQSNGEGCALSFYFQPRTPQNKSHKEETILAKDLVRQALREAEKHGKNGCARVDLDRILDLAGQLRGNQARAKAVFASSARKFWREFDLPPQLPATQVFVNRRFHLKPLAALLGAQPGLCVALVDRQRGRFFELRLDELKECEESFRALPRRRSDGYAGYDAGHAERRVANEIMQHYKAVALRLKEELERGVWERLVVGCHDANWSEFESYLHPYVRQRLLGHFPADVQSLTSDQIREHADRALRAWLDNRRRTLLREALSLARGHGRGVTGLRRVLRALEMGEVQTLLVGENYAAHAVECSACGHVDSHMVPYCVVCGRATRELEDVCDAIIPIAIRRDIELFYVKNEPEFDKVGNIAAVLRFRADQPRVPQVAAAS
jgi:peptide subunit release factor 1 (eRF1)